MLALLRLDGGIGRRAGLKHPFPRGSAGSTPALGTTNPSFAAWIFFCQNLQMRNGSQWNRNYITLPLS